MSNAPARVTVTYRVQVVRTYRDGTTSTEYLGSFKSKTKAFNLAKIFTGLNNGVHSIGQVISHTATTPLH